MSTDENIMSPEEQARYDEFLKTNFSERPKDPLDASDRDVLEKTSEETIDGKIVVEKDVEDFTAGDYAEDVFQGVAYGASKGIGSMYNLATRFGNYLEEDVLGGGVDIVPNEKYEVELEAPRTTAGSIASGAAQLGIGFVPGLQIFRLGSWAAKSLSYGASKLGLTGGTATNLLATGIGKKVVSSSTAQSMAKGGATAAIAEQLTFDHTDPRLADLMATSDIEFLQDVGNLLKYNEGDSEITGRIKMAIEGLGIGIVADGAVTGLSLLGRAILPKKGGVDTVLPQKKSKKKKAMTVEELEQLASQVQSPTGELSEAAAKIIKDSLENKGVYTKKFINKYVGSINLNRINKDQFEIYNLINETGDILKKKHQKGDKTKPWPNVKSNDQSMLEAAKLLGHKDTNDMLKVIEGNEGALQLTKDKKGNVVLGAGLEGATAYALSARQLMVDTADVLFDLAEEAQILKKKGPDFKSQYDEVKAAYVQQLLTYESIQNTVNGIANESGRLLQSFNVNMGNARKARYIQDIVNSAGPDVDNLIKNMADNSTLALADRIDVISKGVDKNLMQKIKTGIGQFWYNSILSAIDTQAVNIAGNFGVQFARTIFEGSVGATRGSLRLLGARMTGKDIDPSTVMLFGDVKQRIRGMTTGKASGGTLGQIERDALKGVQNPVVQDMVLMNIKKGKYQNGKTDIGEVLKAEGKGNSSKGFDVLYKRVEEEMIQNYGASVTNFRKAGRLFAEVFRNEGPVDPRYGRYEISEQIGEKAIPGKVGRAVRLPTTAMASFDTMFKSLADNAALYEAAAKQVRAIKYQVEKNGGKYAVKLPDGSRVTYNTKHFEWVGQKPKMITTKNGKTALVDSPENLNTSQLIEHLVANPTEQMLKDAEKEFLEATFQQQGRLTKGGEYVRRLLDEYGKLPFVGQIGVGSALMPFVRTPLNLLIYAMERTPVGLITPEARANRATLKKLSDIDTEKLTDDQLLQYQDLYRREKDIQGKRRNRQIVGATYLTGAYHLAQMGIITGGGPSDYKERKRLMDEKKWQPYSIKIGDEYYPIGRLDPFSQIAALAADFQYLTNELAQIELNDAERRKAGRLARFVATNMAQNLVRMITDKTYLKSMGEIVDTLYSPRGDIVEKTATAGARVSGTILGGFLPNIVSRGAESFATRDEKGNRQANAFYDPIIKDSYVGMNLLRLFVLKATSKVPGVRDTLLEAVGEDKAYPRLDEFGGLEQRAVPAQIFTDTDNVRNVGSVISKIGNSVVLTRKRVAKETADLSYELAETRVEPKLTSQTVLHPETGKRIKLNPEQYYMRSSREGEQYVIELNKVVNSKLYKRLKEEGGNINRQRRKELLEEAKRRAVEYATELVHRQMWVLADLTEDEWNNLLKKEQDYYLKKVVLEGKTEALTQRSGRLGAK